MAKASPRDVLAAAGMALEGFDGPIGAARPTERLTAPKKSAPKKPASKRPASGSPKRTPSDDEAEILRRLEALKRKPTGRKLQANFRATPRTLLLLRLAAVQQGRSQASIVEEALELFAAKHGIEI